MQMSGSCGREPRPLLGVVPAERALEANRRVVARGVPVPHVDGLDRHASFEKRGCERLEQSNNLRQDALQYSGVRYC